MIGIQAKFECPSCGMIIPVRQPVMKVSGGYKFIGPKRCGCGRRGSFTLLSFKEVKIDFIPEGFEIKKIEEAKPSKRKK